MSWLADNLAFDLFWVLIAATTLGAVYVAVFWALELLPLGDDRRATVARLKPLVGVLVALVFALYAANALFSRYAQVLPFALLLVLVGFFLGSRGLVRDFFSGVALRAEQSCRVGDHIRVGDTRGRITELGPRAIALETPDGDNALIPYSQAALQPIIRTRAVDSGASRTFIVSEPSEVPYAVVCATIERAALLHHWGSAARAPEVTSRGDGQIEVTVFALAQTHAADVEQAVRKAVEGKQTS